MSAFFSNYENGQELSLPYGLTLPNTFELQFWEVAIRFSYPFVLFRKLEQLDLERNNIGDKGAIALSKHLPRFAMKFVQNEFMLMEAAFPFDDNFGFDDILLAAIFWTESQKRRHNTIILSQDKNITKKRSYSCYRKTIILLCL